MADCLAAVVPLFTTWQPLIVRHKHRSNPAIKNGFRSLKTRDWLSEEKFSKFVMGKLPHAQDGCPEQADRASKQADQ